MLNQFHKQNGHNVNERFPNGSAHDRHSADVLSFYIGFLELFMAVEASQVGIAPFTCRLTGLLNRRGIIDTIDKSLSRPDASKATLLVDIDNLKVINDMPLAMR